MKSIMVINTVSIILGIVTLAYKSHTYTGKQEDHGMGPIKAALESKKIFSWSPIRGGLVSRFINLIAYLFTRG